jgi:two-component system, sensor histidine kinase and response regulator
MFSTEKATIILADDQPANLKLLERMLKQQGYDVRSFPRGRLALAAADHCPPDLILLDINMPEMNGFEVCERLKSNPKLAPIPVIFLSALNETEDKVKAFRAGGVDYVTKPFQFEEVQSRVETHLKLHQLQRALQQQNERLEDLVRSRTRELAEAHARLKILDRAKSDFLHLISHGLRTPLNGLLGVGQLLLEESGSSPEAEELRGLFEDSSRRILAIVENALLLTQIEVEGEQFAWEHVLLATVVDCAMGHAVEFARARRVNLEAEAAPTVSILGTEDLLVKAVQALLEMAIRFSEAGETVRLACHPLANATQITIQSNGPRIPDPLLVKFFDLFSIGEASSPVGDIGLGPPLAYRILSLFGGAVTIVNQNPSGMLITVSLRCAPTAL